MFFMARQTMPTLPGLWGSTRTTVTRVLQFNAASIDKVRNERLSGKILILHFNTLRRRVVA
jgi:hypothetical protein